MSHLRPERLNHLPKGPHLVASDPRSSTYECGSSAHILIDALLATMLHCLCDSKSSYYIYGFRSCSGLPLSQYGPLFDSTSSDSHDNPGDQQGSALPSMYYQLGNQGSVT